MSLGCPKALVDSEEIVTGLVRAGYEVALDDPQADVVVVNTCGFIDSAKAESYQVIEQALQSERRVVVTGCLGKDRDALRARYPQLEFVSGPAETGAVLDAVAHFTPPSTQPWDVSRVRMTPPHYAYLKISEGCNHKCSFCIIPHMRGRLRSRTVDDILADAEALRADGVKEVMLIAQDLSAYGSDIGYRKVDWSGAQLACDLYTLCERLGDLIPWVRLHYVYPYPHVDRLLPLMSAAKLLPYLDMPLQHASPRILKAMRRPAAAEKTLQRLQHWRTAVPELAIRSTFIVGFPGETDDDFAMLLDFLEDAQLDRAGCFTYSPVAGAEANELVGSLPERDKLDRQETFYEVQTAISARRLERHVGKRLRVIVDEVTPHGGVGRSRFDAPEIDGVVHIDSPTALRAGDFVWVAVQARDEHDLYGRALGDGVELR